MNLTHLQICLSSSEAADGYANSFIKLNRVAEQNKHLHYYVGNDSCETDELLLDKFGRRPNEEMQRGLCIRKGQKPDEILKLLLRSCVS